MKALVVLPGSERRELSLAEISSPEPRPDDLVVAVRYAGFNRADLALSDSHYPTTGAPIAAGKELAGTVIGIGSECVGFQIGDRVMALSNGCFAQIAAVDHRLAIPLPDHLPITTAAALPAWYLTAHNALVTEGGIAAGGSVLVQGATTGVGLAVAQLAKLRGAGLILGVGRNSEKLARLAEVGFDAALQANSDWPAEVARLTEGRGVDVVVDMVGGETLNPNLVSLRLGGKMVAVGRLGGGKTILDLETLALKRLSIVGVTFRSRSLAERATIVEAFRRDVMESVSEGALSPVIDRIFAIEAFREARDYVMQDSHFGKVMLELPS